MSSSGNSFSLKELWQDKWFPASLGGSIACAGLILAGIALWNYHDKISVRPIAEVVRVDAVDGDPSFDVKPISQITDDKSAKAVAWAGWAIALSDLCKVKGGSFSQGFSNAFQKGTAKLMIPAGVGTQWTVANAELSANDCANVIASDKSHGIYAVFDAKIPAISGQQVKAYFVPKHEESAWQARPIP
jgi:hypothetical protein